MAGVIKIPTSFIPKNFNLASKSFCNLRHAGFSSIHFPDQSWPGTKTLELLCDVVVEHVLRSGKCNFKALPVF